MTRNRAESTSRISNEAGVSLLEVLISVIIISVGILGLAPMFTLAIQTNSQSKDYTLVGVIAKDKIEYYESLDSLTMPPMPYSEYEPSVQGLYSRTTIINDATSDTTMSGGIYQISVAVGWVDAANMSRSTTFSTIINK